MMTTIMTMTMMKTRRKAEAELTELKKRWEEDLDANRLTVDEDDIARVISMMSGVPAERVREDENTRLKGMKDVLSQRVIAQQRAITRICRAITRNRLGLKDPNRPIGTFMFVGPTGVGKTHLVKTLAQHLFGPLSHIFGVYSHIVACGETVIDPKEGTNLTVSGGFLHHLHSVCP